MEKCENDRWDFGTRKKRMAKIKNHDAKTCLKICLNKPLFKLRFGKFYLFLSNAINLRGGEN